MSVRSSGWSVTVPSSRPVPACSDGARLDGRLLLGCGYLARPRPRHRPQQVAQLVEVTGDAVALADQLVDLALSCPTGALGLGLRLGHDLVRVLAGLAENLLGVAPRRPEQPLRVLVGVPSHRLRLLDRLRRALLGGGGALLGLGHQLRRLGDGLVVALCVQPLGLLAAGGELHFEVGTQLLDPCARLLVQGARRGTHLVGVALGARPHLVDLALGAGAQLRDLALRRGPQAGELALHGGALVARLVIGHGPQLGGFALRDGQRLLGLAGGGGNDLLRLRGGVERTSVDSRWADAVISADSVWAAARI